MEFRCHELTSKSGLAQRLRDRIESREAIVGIIGLGYVGLPLALAFVDAGFVVQGFDTDARKIEMLERGESYIRHLGSERLRSAAARSRFSATGDFNRLAGVDVSLIAVPTPLTRQREPEMRYVRNTAEQIAERLRPGQLIVLESTTYPGTCDELVRPILEKGGLVAGRHFHLAYSPEREDPGNRGYSTRSIPKIVGGIDPESARLAELLYAKAIDQVVSVSSSRVAEATKLTENIFRAVNIALVNELKMIYDRMGIDIWEVLDAATTKPFGFMRFDPGPGLGGHCIPLDPFYLTWKAREHKLSTRFIELAGEVNLGMPRWVVDKLQLALNERGKALRGSRVLLLGLAYKRDVDDPRESPSFELMQLLVARGASVCYHDPFVERMPRMRSWPELPRLESVALDEPLLAAQDCVLIATDHRAVDYELVLRAAPLIVDTRGVYRMPLANVVKA